MTAHGSESVAIRGGTVVDPSQGLNARRDVVIENGRIARLTEPGKGEARTVIDASGLVVAPGFVDIHVHLRYPGGDASETVETGTASAAAGGFTSICCMPNTSPVADSTLVVSAIIDRAASPRSTGVRVHPIAAVTKGQTGTELVDFAALASAGAVAFSDDGRPVGNAAVMRRAMECVRDLGSVILDHCEDLSLTGDGVMHEGPAALRLGLKGIPRLSEASNVARDCALALATGARLHICHVSNVESVEVIRWYKSRGAPVTAEVSPHHLTLTDELVATGTAGRGPFDTHAKMKPPLCEESDRRALIAALEDGTLDCIATDHAPHSPASKAAGFDEAPFGIIGMENAFPVLHTEFVATGRWTLEFLVDRLTARAARILGLPAGTLSVGAAADVALLDPASQWTVDAERIVSRSRNCPWVGQEMKGAVAGTLVAGRVVWSSPLLDGARRGLPVGDARTGVVENR